MIGYVRTKENNIIVLVFDSKYQEEGMEEINIPDEYLTEQEDVTIGTFMCLNGNLGDYKVEDGSLVYTGEATKAEEEAKTQAETERKRSEQLQTAAVMYVRNSAATLTDEQALEVSLLFEDWSGDGVQYKKDQILQYNNGLYRVVQDHTSQSSWAPDSAPSLFSSISISEGDGVEVWTQPTGAHNAYNIGDRVHYPGASDPIYVSTIDGNTWSPDAYPAGWKLEE